MKKIFAFLILLMILSPFLFSQNVGIGTLTPTRATLEVIGAVDATSAILVEKAVAYPGRNWPGIGYNSHFNAGNKSMFNGYGAKHYLKSYTGYMF